MERSPASKEGNAADLGAARIPRAVHQLWIGGATMPERFRASPAAWRRIHPDWSHRLWGDREVEALLAEHYPELAEAYHGFPLAQRTDLARYAILYRHGGIYCDLDVIPARSFEPLLGHTLVFPETAPLGLSNDLILATPGHPFLGELLERLPSSVRSWSHPLLPHHFRVLLGSGPLFVTLALGRSACRREAYRLPAKLYSSQNPARVYVLHVPGNSWVRWDTHLFTFLWKRWRWIGLSLALLLIALALR